MTSKIHLKNSTITLNNISAARIGSGSRRSQSESTNLVSSYSTTSHIGIGELVASGLGLTGSPTTSPASLISTIPAGTASTLLSSALRVNSTRALSSNISSHIPLKTATETKTNLTTLSGKLFNGSKNASKIPNFHHTRLPSNNSINIDACFTSWVSFWSANESAYSVSVIVIPATPVSTYLATGSFTSDTQISTTLTETDTLGIFTETKTISVGGFELSTTTETTTDIFTFTFTDPYEPVTTETFLYTTTSWGEPDISSTTYIANISTPSCVLPTLVPQCQSQWSSWESLQLSTTAISQPSCAFEDYFSASCESARSSAEAASESFYSRTRVPSPLCSQASLGPSLCAKLKDLYIEQWILEWYNPEEYIHIVPLSDAGYSVWYANASYGYTSSFPTASTLAPGCTLGCARCAITGGAVRLLYWPTTATASLNGSNTFKLSNVPVTAVDFGTTLTSPTNYISFASVYAQDSCSTIGTTYRTTIIAIPTSVQLSSLYVSWPWPNVMTASFNFTDLNPPVPQSIYSEQLKCTQYMPPVYELGAPPLQEMTTYTCPTTLGPYEPIRK